MKSNETDSDFEFFKVRSFDWRSTSSSPIERYHVLSCADWVNVVAFTSDEKLISVKQFRHGVSATNYELPGGMISRDQTPLNAAQEELHEEAGYISKHWYETGRYRPNAALQDNWCYSFICFDATLDAARPIGNVNFRLHLIEAQGFAAFFEAEFMSQALMATSLLLAKRNLHRVTSASYLREANKFLAFL